MEKFLRIIGRIMVILLLACGLTIQIKPEFMTFKTLTIMVGSLLILAGMFVSISIYVYKLEDRLHSLERSFWELVKQLYKEENK